MLQNPLLTVTGSGADKVDYSNQTKINNPVYLFSDIIRLVGPSKSKTCLSLPEEDPVCNEQLKFTDVLGKFLQTPEYSSTAAANDSLPVFTNTVNLNEEINFPNNFSTKTNAGVNKPEAVPGDQNVISLSGMQEFLTGLFNHLNTMGFKLAQVKGLAENSGINKNYNLTKELRDTALDQTGTIANIPVPNNIDQNEYSSIESVEINGKAESSEQNSEQPQPADNGINNLILNLLKLNKTVILNLNFAGQTLKIEIKGNKKEAGNQNPEIGSLESGVSTQPLPSVAGLLTSDLQSPISYCNSGSSNIQEDSFNNPKVELPVSDKNNSIDYNFTSESADKNTPVINQKSYKQPVIAAGTNELLIKPVSTNKSNGKDTLGKFLNNPAASNDKQDLLQNTSVLKGTSVKYVDNNNPAGFKIAVTPTQIKSNQKVYNRNANKSYQEIQAAKYFNDSVEINFSSSTDEMFSGNKSNPADINLTAGLKKKAIPEINGKNYNQQAKSNELFIRSNPENTTNEKVILEKFSNIPEASNDKQNPLQNSNVFNSNPIKYFDDNSLVGSKIAVTETQIKSDQKVYNDKANKSSQENHVAKCFNDSVKINFSSPEDEIPSGKKSIASDTNSTVGLKDKTLPKTNEQNFQQQAKSIESNELYFDSISAKKTDKNATPVRLLNNQEILNDKKNPLQTGDASNGNYLKYVEDSYSAASRIVATGTQMKSINKNYTGIVIPSLHSVPEVESGNNLTESSLHSSKEERLTNLNKEADSNTAAGKASANVREVTGKINRQSDNKYTVTVSSGNKNIRLNNLKDLESLLPELSLNNNTDNKLFDARQKLFYHINGIDIINNQGWQSDINKFSNANKKVSVSDLKNYSINKLPEILQTDVHASSDFNGQKINDNPFVLKTDNGIYSVVNTKTGTAGDDQSGKNSGGSNKQFDDSKIYTAQLLSNDKNTVIKNEIASQSLKQPADLYKTINAGDLISEISNYAGQGKSGSIMLQLKPENLGRVKIVIKVIDKVVHANLEVENESVKQTVQNNISNLKQSLNINGLQLSSITISLSGGEDKSGKTFAQQQKKKTGRGSFAKKIDAPGDVTASKNMGYNTYEYLI